MAALLILMGIFSFLIGSMNGCTQQQSDFDQLYHCSEWNMKYDKTGKPIPYCKKFERKDLKKENSDEKEKIKN